MDRATLNAGAVSVLAFLGYCVVGCGASSETGRTSVPEQHSAVEEPVVEVLAAEVGASGDHREDRLQRVDRFLESGETGKAAELFRQLLVIDPQDVEVLFRLANVLAAEGNFEEGIRLLDAIPKDHPEAGLPALGQSADWCFQLERYEQAEQKYLDVLKVAPDASRARRQLAYLLNRQGRRHEAAEHIRELCKEGNVRQDELHALIVLSDAMVGEASEADTIDYSPIGASGEARKLFTERKFAEAAVVLRATVERGDAPASVVAFYGRIVAEAQDDEEFLWWLGRTDESVREFSEYWSAIAAYLTSRRQYDAATRALLEALDRDPTDFMSINRLHQMMKVLGRPDEAEKWDQRWKANHEVLLANNAISDSQTPNADAMAELALHLLAIDRKLEAVMWKSLESYYRNLPPEAMKHWNLERQRLVSVGGGFPDRASRLSMTSLEDYPLPDLESLANAAVEPRRDRQWIEEKPHPASFTNVADRIGLAHSYRVAPADIEFGFAMYHQSGGGVAVLDYDCDGSPDLYLAQGAADPPQFVADESNLLYRTEDGRVREVTRLAMAEEFRYTIGCTAGDWNQDGFPDLITANIGANRLFINNGDGTFTATILEGSDDLDRMPASVAIADLNGDALPDIFEVNYIEDPDIATRPNRDAAGKVVEAVGPADFSPAIDRIGINDGSGRATFMPISQDASAAHRGLGVVIANLDGTDGNDVFVGNDKSANQLWVRDRETKTWSDIAVINGTAYSYGGAGTASMGIAAGDFDQSGTLDLHIANFQNESVCLYLGRDGFFQDRAVQYNLGIPSRSVLGFGSQSLDFDNNGLPDLVVTNGHIDKYEKMSGPFKQLPQLFANLGDKFQQIEVNDSSGYWQKGHLGRALARLDFNGDGRNDFVVTHLGEASALMLNETLTANHWLQLQLVGVQSERDAIGARISVQVGERELSDWVIGGDGYLCRNEALVSFGLGDATKVDQIVIDWPSGVKQTWTDVAVDRRILVVESDSEPFTL